MKFTARHLVEQHSGELGYLPRPPDSYFENIIPDEAFHRLIGPVVESIYLSGTPNVQTYTVRTAEAAQKGVQWGQRIFGNVIANSAYTNPVLAASMAKGRVEIKECARIFKKNYVGFILFCAYPALQIDLKNYVLVAITVLSDCIVIEQVNSKTNGSPGGRNLIKVLITHLKEWAKRVGIKTLRVVAITERSFLLFKMNGLTEADTSHLTDVKSHQKHLVCEL